VGTPSSIEDELDVQRGADPSEGRHLEVVEVTPLDVGDVRLRYPGLLGDIRLAETTANPHSSKDAADPLVVHAVRMRPPGWPTISPRSPDASRPFDCRRRVKTEHFSPVEN